MTASASLPARRHAGALDKPGRDRGRDLLICASLALDALWRHWRVIFGRTPPADLSKDLLGRTPRYVRETRSSSRSAGATAGSGSDDGLPMFEDDRCGRRLVKRSR